MTTKRKNLQLKKTNTKTGIKVELMNDLRQIIEKTRQSIAYTINSNLTALYWNIGNRIRSEILLEKRADYGKEIVATVSRQLATEFGQGFAEKSLRRMLQFVEVFPDEQIVATLLRQLSWSHFIELIPIKEVMKRDFYAEMCRIEKWSVRTLRTKISSLLFERTALSRKPEQLAQNERIELLELDRSGIHVSEYLTAMSSKEILQEKLHQAIQQARQKFE